METQIQAQYVRLFTDENGISLFEDKEIELDSGFAVPPAEPLHFAQFFGADRSFWIGAPTTWKGEESHPAPGRQIFITVRGEYQVKDELERMIHQCGSREIDECRIIDVLSDHSLCMSADHRRPPP